MLIMVRQISLLVTLVVLMTSRTVSALSSRPDTLVTLAAKAGLITGSIYRDDGYAFLGIPYATADRWMPPVPADRSNTTIVATELGPSCPQTCREVTMFCPQRIDEQCLFVNVWTPFTDASASPMTVVKNDDVSTQKQQQKQSDTPPASVPVFVFIHGGSFMTGGSDLPALQGAELAKATGAIIVTFNYRLSVFGFPGIDLTSTNVSQSQMPLRASTPNLGILDQRAAIEWIAANIASFGGDPTRMTLAGQSAGAASVLLHMANASIRPLFNNLVLMSPPAVGFRSPAEAYGRTLDTFVRAGCSPHLSAASLTQCIASKTTRQLLDAIQDVSSGVIDSRPIQKQQQQETGSASTSTTTPLVLDTSLCPVVDGIDIPKHPLDILADHTLLAGKTIIIGSLSNETAYAIRKAITAPVSSAMYTIATDALFLSRAQDVRDVFASSVATDVRLAIDRGDYRPIASTIETDHMFVCAPQRSAKRLVTSAKSSQQPPPRVFTYFWEQAWTGAVGDPVGRLCGHMACHTTDLAILFRSPADTRGSAISTLFRSTLRSIMSHGDPNTNVTQLDYLNASVSVSLPVEWKPFNASGLGSFPVLRFTSGDDTFHHPHDTDSTPTASSLVIVESIHPRQATCRVLDTGPYDYEAPVTPVVPPPPTLDMRIGITIWCLLSVAIVAQIGILVWARAISSRVMALVGLIQSSVASLSAISPSFTGTGASDGSKHRFRRSETTTTTSKVTMDMDATVLTSTGKSTGDHDRTAITVDADAFDMIGDLCPTPVALLCHTLTYTVRARDGSRTSLLDDVSFACWPGSLTALVGPSGAGKTTLMNLLARRVPDSCAEQFIYLRGRPLSQYKSAVFQRMVGFVPQHDPPYTGLTPTEILTSYAKLELPRSTTPAGLARRVSHILNLLGLTPCANVVIRNAADGHGGGGGGLSGGQLRRIPIAVTLLKCPSVLILDEPTSGLDARSSLEVMQVLAHLAQHGYTIIVSIHQPRREIFNLFTDIVLLACGRLLFRGDPVECVRFSRAVKGIGERTRHATGSSAGVVDFDQTRASSPILSLNNSSFSDNDTDHDGGSYTGVSDRDQHVTPDSIDDMMLNPADAILDAVAAIPRNDIHNAALLGQQFSSRMPDRDVTVSVSTILSSKSVVTTPSAAWMTELTTHSSHASIRSDSDLETVLSQGGLSTSPCMRPVSPLSAVEPHLIGPAALSKTGVMSTTVTTTTAATSTMTSPKASRLGVFGQAAVTNARWWRRRPLLRKISMLFISIIAMSILGILERRNSDDALTLALHMKGLVVLCIGLAALKNINISFDYYDDRDLYNHDVIAGSVSSLAFFTHRLVYETAIATIEATLSSVSAYLLMGCSMNLTRMVTAITLIVVSYNSTLALYTTVYATRLSRPEARSVSFLLQSVVALTCGLWIQPGDTPAYTPFSWLQSINPAYWVVTPLLHATTAQTGQCLVTSRDRVTCLAWIGDTMLQHARIDSSISPNDGVLRLLGLWCVCRVVQVCLLMRDAYWNKAYVRICRVVKRWFK